MMTQKQILLLGLLACSMHHMYSADNETLTAAMTPSYRQDRRLSIDETSGRGIKGAVTDLTDIDFNDSENPPLVTIPLTNNDTSNVDDILAQYPVLAQDPEALAAIRAHLVSNPRLMVQSPTARTTRRINFFKYNTGTSQHSAQFSSQQQPDDRKNSNPAATDSEKTIENPAPHGTGTDIIGNAIVTTLMARHTTSSRQQTKKTYLTGAVGLIATAACGLMVRYLDNQCS